jgi:hypothetical protein
MLHSDSPYLNPRDTSFPRKLTTVDPSGIYRAVPHRAPIHMGTLHQMYGFWVACALQQRSISNRLHLGLIMMMIDDT